MSVYEEPETLRLLGLDRLPKEQNDPNEEFLRRLDMERAADRIEELCAGWTDGAASRFPVSSRPGSSVSGRRSTSGGIAAARPRRCVRSELEESGDGPADPQTTKEERAVAGDAGPASCHP